MKPNFETFLTERNDQVDQAAYDLASALVVSSKNNNANQQNFLWNMEIIGEILEAVKSILEKHSLPVCWPYYEDEIPCFQTKGCDKINCPVKITE